VNILVTGGAGYIGSHTVRRLLDAGHRVVAYDNLSEGHAQALPTGVLVQGDLADQPLLTRTLQDHRVDAVVHFAASCYVGVSVEQPLAYYTNNVAHTLSLLRAMASAGVPAVVFSSSCATYGVPQRVPIDESFPQQPINPYGASKWMVERILADTAASGGVGSVSLRYFNAAGAAPDGTIGEDHRPETHLLPLVLHAALGLRPAVKVFGTDYPTPDGTCVRDYVHVDDLAEAHVLALSHARPGEARFYNLGIGRGYSVREVIRQAEAVTGRPVPAQDAPRRAGDPPELVGAVDKVRRELGWQARYTELGPILETAWRWHQAHPQGYTS